MENLNTFLSVTTAKLRGMKAKESRIFTERENEIPGNTSHGYARRAGIQINTAKCHIINYEPLNITCMTIVTRGNKWLNREDLINNMKISVAKLKTMEKGQVNIFTEKTTKNSGSLSQNFATRIGVKIKTEVCRIVIPKSESLIKAVIVTKC